MPTGPHPFSPRDLAAALLVILIWSMNFVAFKFGLRDFTPLQLGAARFLFATFPLLFFIRPPAIGWRWVAAYGLLQGVGQFALVIFALKVGMTAALAPVLMQIQVFMTALMGAALMGERLGRPLKTGLLLAAIGLGCFAWNALAVGGSSEVTLAGILLTLLGATSWSGSNIVVRKLQAAGAKYAPLALVVWSSAVSAVCFLMLSAIFEDPAPWRQWIAAPLDAWLWVAYLGWIGNVVSFWIWASLLARHAASRVAPFSLGVPVFGIIAGIVLLDETVTSWQWVGTGFVLSALLFVVRGARRV
ncbi:MAG: hypothetical protein RIS35_328 [Pseudomonadota bacterium]|jgi:O-acetylserine/cysteine efflux transporter